MTFVATHYPTLLTAFFLRNALRTPASLVRLLFVLSVGILLTACASSSGRSNAFSHSSYDFVGLNSTLTSAPQAERILGMVQLDITEVALNLPPSVDVASISASNFRLEGSELAQQFYEVNGSGVVHFSATNDYSRVFNLGYVVDELEVSDFSVVANVSYTTADGAQGQWVTRAPVRVAAVGGAALTPNRFVAFSGLNSGVVNATVSRSFTGRFEAARAVAENDEVVFLQADSVEALVNASDMNYNASASEADVEFFAREEERGEVNFTDLARSGNVTQALRAQISLTLNEGRPTERRQSLTYTIAARTPLSVVNGNTSVSGSFLRFLDQSDQRPSEDYLNATGTGYGANVSAIEVSFSFGYEREVLEERAADASNQALRFRAPGSIEENSLGGRAVNGLGNVLSSLGIEAGLPSDAAEDGYSFLPTLYYRLVSFEDGKLLACGNRYYVDHQSGASVRVSPQIADAYALNYEDEAQRVNACRLQASLNGVQYEDVVTAADADYSLVRNLEGRTLPEATNSALCENDVMAARAGTGADACRYVAEVDISLLDVNEAPRLDVAAQVSSVSEGDVGSASGFAATDLEVIAGEDPSSLTGGLRRLANLSYEDTDQNGTGAALRASGAPQIVSVVPRLPAGAENLFVIDEVEGRDNESALFLNQTLLRAVDYETLRASGHSGYSLRLRVRDNSTAGLTADEEFVLGIEDVVYKPVLVGDGYVSTSNVSDEIQQILPGFQQFVFNGGPFLGRLQALDPESNSSVGIAYRYDGIELNAGVMTAPDSAETALETTLGLNFAVAGDRLNLIGLGLREVTTDSFPNLTAPADVSELPVDFNVQVWAFNEASADRSDAASRLIEIETKVEHNEDLSPPLPLARFAQGMYVGRVAEGQTGDGTVDGVPVLNLTGVPLNLTPPNLPNEVDPFYRLVSEEEVLAAISGLQPQLRASLAALFTGAAGERLFDLSGSEAFAIDSATGEIYLENNYRVDFSGRHRYVLLAQILPRLNATSSLLSAADRFLLSDYTAVVVDVVDDNSAPQIIDLRSVASGVSVDEDRISVTVRLEEGALTERVLARLRVRDDNPLPAGLSLMPQDVDGAEITESFFVVERVSESARDAAGGYSADYAVRLQRALDFETAPQVEEYHIFADGGVYVVNASGEIESAAASDSVKQATLFLRADVLNVDEPIALRVTRDAAGMNEFGADEEARLLETAPSGLAQLVDAMGASLADQSVYIQLEDPEGSVGASNVPSYRLQVPPALDGVLSLEFNASGPYFRLNITDAVALENAGDGVLFEVSVNVADNETGQASAAVAFNLRIVNDLSQDTLAMLGALPGIELSEQRALDIYDGNANERTLLSGLFNLTAVHADYDEFFPDSNKRFVDLRVRRGAIEYPQDISDNVLNTDRFGLFDFAVASGAVGRVDLLLREGRLIDPRLIGTSSNLTFGVSVEDRSSGSGASTEVGSMMVKILPTASERVVFASAEAVTTPLEPPVFDFAYTQSDYAEELALDACEGDAAEVGTNVIIDGLCYATIEIRDSSGERLNVVERRPREADQIVYTGDLAAALSSTERPRELGIIFTDAAVEVTDLGVYRLTEAGDLEAAADYFTEYFELSVNQSYNGAARPALVISQRVYSELNRSNQGSQQVLSEDAYLALDLLALNSTRPQQSLSYFVVAGEAGGSARNATQRAIAQLNVEVSAPSDNDPAFLSQLKIMDVFLSNSTPTEITQAQLSDLVNTPTPALSFTLMNLDGDNDDDTLDQNVSVLLEVVNEEGRLVDGIFDVDEGTASGNQLIRLGADADDTILVNTTLGDTSREFTGSFQLARNVAGEATIRVTFEEFARGSPDQALSSTQPETYRIRVTKAADIAPALAAVAIGDETSPLMEDASALGEGADTNIQVNITDADFSDAVVKQAIEGVELNIAATTIGGVAAPTPVFRLSSAGATSTVTGDTASVTQGLSYTEHGFGTTTFAVTLTMSEPRGFDNEEATFTLSEPLTTNFIVRFENDPLQVCGDSPEVDCGGQRNLVVSFALQDDRPITTKDAVLFLKDDDYVFQPDRALPTLVGAASVFTPTNIVNRNNAERPTSRILEVLAADVRIERGNYPGTVRVTLPVRLDVSADFAEYDGLFQDPNQQEVTFTPIIRTLDDATTMDLTARIYLADRNEDGRKVNGCPTNVEVPIGFTAVCNVLNLAVIGNDDDTLAGNYLLTDNITLTIGDWQPLGDDTTAFSGRFEGDNFVISNLVMDSDSSQYKDAGLFGVIRDAQIRNLGIIAHNVTALSKVEDTSAGVLAGRALNSNIRNVHINLTEDGVQALAVYAALSGDQDANDFNASSFVGGLIGKSVHSVIEDSSASASAPIRALTLYRPGDTTGDPVGLKASTASAGGLVGWNVGAIRNSFADVQGIFVEAGHPQTGEDSVLYTSAGGLVGEHHAGEIADSYALVGQNVRAGFVYPRTWFFSSLAGFSARDNSDSNFVEDRNDIRTAGGLVGRSAGGLRNSYALVGGNVSALRSDPTLVVGSTGSFNTGLSDEDAELFARGNSSSAGGLIGDVFGAEARVENSYAIIEGALLSTVPDNALAGGLLGVVDAANTDPVGASYYNATRSLADSEGTDFTNTFGASRTVERLQCATPDETDCGSGDGAETFVGWDVDIWDFSDDTLPILSNSPPCRSGEGDCRLR